jgi:hypothetical protein
MRAFLNETAMMAPCVGSEYGPIRRRHPLVFNSSPQAGANKNQTRDTLFQSGIRVSNLSETFFNLVAIQPQAHPAY